MAPKKKLPVNTSWTVIHNPLRGAVGYQTRHHVDVDIRPRLTSLAARETPGSRLEDGAVCMCDQNTPEITRSTFLYFDFIVFTILNRNLIVPGTTTLLVAQLTTNHKGFTKEDMPCTTIKSIRRTVTVHHSIRHRFSMYGRLTAPYKGKIGVSLTAHLT